MTAVGFAWLSAVCGAQAPILEIPVPQIPRLIVGESAPPLAGLHWVKGAPAALGGGRVTVVEFFASWCPTCKETFAHIAELARKYRNRASFVGVSVWEKPEELRNGTYLAHVRDVAAAMPYSVAADNPDGALATQWLGVANFDIPKAFVIDRQGRIAWTGHPLADLDEAIDGVLTNKLDMAAAIEHANAEVAAVQELVNLVTPVQFAIRTQDYSAAVKAINLALDKKPTLEPGFGPTKFLLLLRTNEQAAYAYARELAVGPCKDSCSALNEIAWAIVDDGAKLRNPDYTTAVIVAKQAFDLTNEADPYVADTLAYALYKSGSRDKALELQTKALRLADKTPGMDPKILKELQSRLALFRKGAPPHP